MVKVTYWGFIRHVDVKNTLWSFMETTNHHDQRLDLGSKIATALINQGKDSLAQESELNWLNNFPPSKRIIRGKAYKTVKRIMDLVLVIASIPFWLPLIGVVYLAIIVTSPGAPAIFIQRHPSLS